MTAPINSNNQHLSELFIQSRQPQADKTSCWLATLSATLRVACRVHGELHCFHTSELDILNDLLKPHLGRDLNREDLRLIYRGGRNINTILPITRQIFKTHLPNYTTTIKSMHADSPQFEEKFKEDLHKKGCFTMINFEQEELIGKKGGHFSPVAPYNSSLPKYTKPDPALYYHRQDLMTKNPEVTIIDPSKERVRPGYHSWYDRDYKTVIDAMHTRRPGQTLFRGYVSICLEEKK